MRKLLNRPWFVALLVVAALGAIGWSYWPASGGPPAAAGPTALGPAAPPPAEGEPPARLAPAEALRALPIPAGLRDPFALPEKPAAAAAPVAETPAVVVRLRLSAIWIQSPVVLLLLNNRICQPGDTIEGATVESADAEGAWLRHPGGRSFLTVGHDLALTLSAPSTPTPPSP